MDNRDDAEARAKGRFMLINAMRIAGVVMILAAIAVFNGALPLPDWAGYVLLVLGMISDPIPAIILIVPVFLPSLLTLDVNLVWFGIIMIVVVEMGLITPPIGMNVFTVRSVMPDIRLGAIFSGVVSFVIADAVALAILIAFPIVALGLLAW